MKMLIHGVHPTFDDVRVSTHSELRFGKDSKVPHECSKVGK